MKNNLDAYVEEVVAEFEAKFSVVKNRRFIEEIKSPNVIEDLSIQKDWLRSALTSTVERVTEENVKKIEAFFKDVVTIYSPQGTKRSLIATLKQETK